MRNLSREQIFIIAFLFIIFIIGSGILLKENVGKNMIYSSFGTEDEVLNSEKNNQVHSTEDDSEETIVVHVAGEVFFTGVYELNSGARVIDAINEAGGTTSKANLDSLNLAARLSDAEKIYVPSEIEVDQNFQNKSANFQANSSINNNKRSKININTASAEELQKLSGIGESRANNIITYRNKNGPFSNIEELKDISGIGDKILENIENEITVR